MANEKTFVRGRWSFFEGPTPIVLTELTKADLEVAVGRIAFSICPANLLPWIRLDVSTTLWLFNVVAVDFNGLDLCLVALALYFQSNSFHSRTPFCSWRSCSSAALRGRFPQQVNEPRVGFDCLEFGCGADKISRIARYDGLLQLRNGGIGVADVEVRKRGVVVNVDGGGVLDINVRQLGRGFD